MSDSARPPVEIHPRRAWAITSFALGASLGLAWALAESRTAPMPLGPKVTLKGWPITFRLPDGWKFEQQDADAWSGEIEAHPISNSGMLRMIIRHDRRYRSLQPDEIIHGYVNQRYTESAEQFTSHEALSLGPVAGLCVSGDRLTAHMVYPVSIAAAGLPNGPAIVVEIFAHASGSGPMRRTLRSVCGSIEFVAPRLARSLGDLSGKAGFDCAVPTGLWCVDELSEYSAGVRFAADSGNLVPWCARAWRTFLSGPRTLSDLVYDQAVSDRFAIDLPKRPTDTTLAGHPAAGVVVTEFGRAASVWAIDLGNGAVVMVRGDGPESISDEIDSACRKMAESAQRRTSADEFDVAAARKAGEEAVAAVRRRGLGRAWGEGSKSIWYLYERCGEPLGYLHLHRERESTPGGAGPPSYGYSGSNDLQIRFQSRHRQEHRSAWTINDDAVEFTLDRTVTLVIGDEPRVLTSRFVREASGDDVSVSASIEKRKRSGKLAVGPTFAADPIEDLVIREISERGAGHVAMIRTIGSLPFSAACVRCAVERGPGSDARVRLQTDFDPDRSVLVFDDDGELARQAFGDAAVLRRVKHAEVARLLDWFGKPDAVPESEPPSSMENNE